MVNSLMIVLMLYVVYMIMGEYTRNKVLLDALPPDRKANVQMCLIVL